MYRRGAAKLNRGLAYGGQGRGKGGGDFMIVKANNRDMLWDSDPGVLQRLYSPESHLVVCREDRRKRQFLRQ